MINNTYFPAKFFFNRLWAAGYATDCGDSITEYHKIVLVGTVSLPVHKGTTKYVRKVTGVTHSDVRRSMVKHDLIHL